MNKKAYGTLAFISDGIEYKSKKVMLESYRELVSPQLEYCVQLWSPHYKKDVIALEGVQRRFTRMLPGMDKLSCKERLDGVGLFSLEHRRLSGDMIEVNKMMRGMDRLSREQLFPLVKDAMGLGQLLPRCWLDIKNPKQSLQDDLTVIPLTAMEGQARLKLPFEESL
eukprot:g37044.t1